MTPHTWHEREIIELPNWSDHGWFYGLVQIVIDGEIGLVVAEIFPGEGYALVGIEDNLDDWPQIMADITTYTPALLATKSRKDGP